jgi:hypothetical protein
MSFPNVQIYLKIDIERTYFEAFKFTKLKNPMNCDN